MGININGLLFLNKKQGFTLVELMIVLFISTLIIAGVFSVYTVQRRSYTNQEAVSEMQQNLRAALDLMARELRMAGLDPAEKLGGGISVAQRGRISFSLDLNGDGDVNDSGERVDYGFATAEDTNNDGVPDSGLPINLGRQIGGSGGYQPIAENIEALEFYYLLSNNTGTTSPNPTQLNQIRSVQLSLLARSSNRDSSYTNQNTYTPASGTSWDLNGAASGTSPNDGFRRRLQIVTVYCRNMGI